MSITVRRKGHRFNFLFMALIALVAICLLTSCGSKQENPAPEDTSIGQAQDAKDDGQEDVNSEDDEAQAEVSDTPDDEQDGNADKDAKKTKAEDEAPEPSPADLKRIESLRARIQAVEDASGMTCCVAVIDLAGNVNVSLHGDQQIASASMIKMLVAYTFLEQVQAGTYALDDYYTLKGSDIVGGTGTLCGLGAGAQVTYRDILTRMIDVSDNTGANILIDACGMDAINATAKQLELTGTQLNRHMMDYDAIAAGLENYTCAADIAKLMQMVYEGTFVDDASSSVMMQALRQQQDWGGIRNGLPSNVPFAHKTGALDTVRHDGGIVEAEHPFVLVTLCGGAGFWEQGAFDAMSSIAQVVYADMEA